MGYRLEACFWLKDKDSLIKAKRGRDGGEEEQEEGKGKLCEAEHTVGWERGCRMACVCAAYPFRYNEMKALACEDVSLALRKTVAFMEASNIFRQS